MTAREKGKQYHILLAEDSDADAGLVRLVLRDQSLNHVLHIVKDGEEAVGFIEQADRNAGSGARDPLLLDMHLPKYNGEDILKRLRSTENLAQTPVVVISSSDTLDDRECAQRHAVSTYFSKPSRPADFFKLGRIVRSLLTGDVPLSAPSAPRSEEAR